MLLSVPSLKYVRGLYSGHNLSLEQLSKVDIIVAKILRRDIPNSSAFSIACKCLKYFRPACPQTQPRLFIILHRHTMIFTTK